MAMQPPDATAVKANVGASNGAAPQRGLLSSNFVPNGRMMVNAAGSFGRGFLTAGDRLRDLIVPESLATVVGSWTGVGGQLPRDKGARNIEKLRDELDQLLASSCPLCDSVIIAMDRPFVDAAEGDTGWEI